MIPIIPLILRIRMLRGSPIWLRRKRTHTGKVVLLPIAAAFMTLSSCKEDTPAPPAAYVTDTEPVGAGLTVIGFAMVGAAVVLVLGRLLR